MENIIDVEYREITDIEAKSNEELCQEVNLYWNQMEALGRLGLEFAARAGKRLLLIKSRLHHGEWEDWCKDNLNFSKSKAEKMMKLSLKIDDENSLIFKSVNFTDIGISKVWALLSAPEEVAEEVLEKEEISDMTVRELKEELKKTKEELESETEEMKSLREETKCLKAQLQEVKALPENPEPADSEEIERLKTELRKAEDKLTKEKEKQKRSKASIDAERDKAVKEAVEKTKEETAAELEKKHVEENKKLAESNRQAAEEIERLKRNQGESVITFKVQTKNLQTDFAGCIGAIDRTSDENQAERMKDALRRLMEELIETI